MKERHLLVLLVVLSLAIKLPLIFFTTSFGVDESLYLSTARHFVETGEFGLNTEFYDFRFISPLMPAIESVFYALGGQMGVLLIAPIFSTLTVLVFYYLGKYLINPKAAIITAAIAFFNPALLIAASRPLTESVAIFFFSATILAMYMTLKGGKIHRIFPIVFPALAVLTFLIRFQYGGLLFVFFVVYLVISIPSRSWKNLLTKNFLIGVVVGILIFAPWAAFNMVNFGSPIGGASHQASTDLGFNPSVAYLYVPYLAIILGSTIPFVAFGIYKNLNRKNLFVISAFAVVFLTQFFVFGKVAEERYLLPVLPAAALLATMGYFALKKHYKKLTVYTFAAFMLINIAAGFYGVNLFQEYPRYTETKDAVEFMIENCSSPVMSNSFTQVWYYSGFENVPLRPDRQDSLDLAREKGTECILVSNYETPFNDILSDSNEVQEIYDAGSVVVYRVL